MIHRFEKRSSIFGRVRDALTLPKLKDRQREELREFLRHALVDRRLSEQELSSIHEVYLQSNLSEKDFERIREEIFDEFVKDFLRIGKIFAGDRAAVVEVARQLGFSRESLNAIERHFQYFELIHAIETSSLDRLPIAGNSKVILRKGEIDYFTAKGSLLEERVTKRELVGRSHGISIPTPIKGVRYRVGQSRGKMISERGMVPISYGEFTVTNRRLVFTGDKKSANSEFSKLQDYELFTDAIRYSMTTRQTPITVLFDDPRCAEVAGHYIRRLLDAGI
jgi:hypothetical protein